MEEDMCDLCCHKSRPYKYYYMEGEFKLILYSRPPINSLLSLLIVLIQHDSAEGVFLATWSDAPLRDKLIATMHLSLPY